MDWGAINEDGGREGSKGDGGMSMLLVLRCLGSQNQYSENEF